MNIGGYVTNETPVELSGIIPGNVYKLKSKFVDKQVGVEETKRRILIKLFMSFIKNDADESYKKFALDSKKMTIEVFAKQFNHYILNELKYFSPVMTVLQFVNLLSKTDGFLYVYVDTLMTDGVYKCYYYMGNELKGYLNNLKFVEAYEKAYINIPKDVLDGLDIYLATPPSKGGKKSIKRNKIRGSKSKLRRRSSVRRKKTTRRKHN